MSTADRIFKRQRLQLSMKNSVLFRKTHYLNLGFGVRPGSCVDSLINVNTGFMYRPPFALDISMEPFNKNRWKPYLYNKVPVFNSITNKEYLDENNQNKSNNTMDLGEYPYPIFRLVNYRTDMQSDLIHISWRHLMSDERMAIAMMNHKHARFRRIKLNIKCNDTRVKTFPGFYYKDRPNEVQLFGELVPRIIRSAREKSLTIKDSYQKNSYYYFPHTNDQHPGSIFSHFMIKRSDLPIFGRQSILDPYSSRLKVVDDRFGVHSYFMNSPADGYITYDNYIDKRPKTYSTDIIYKYAPNDWFDTSYIMEAIAQDRPITHSDYFKTSVYPDPRLFVICEDYGSIRTGKDLTTHRYEDVISDFDKVNDYPTAQYSDIKRTVKTDSGIHTYIEFETKHFDTRDPSQKDKCEEHLNGLANTSIELNHCYTVSIEIEMEFMARLPNVIDFKDLDEQVPETSTKPDENQPIIKPPVKIPAVERNGIMYLIASLLSILGYINSRQGDAIYVKGEF